MKKKIAFLEECVQTLKYMLTVLAQKKNEVVPTYLNDILNEIHDLLAPNFISILFYVLNNQSKIEPNQQNSWEEIKKFIADHDTLALTTDDVLLEHIKLTKHDDTTSRRTDEFKRINDFLKDAHQMTQRGKIIDVSEHNTLIRDKLLHIHEDELAYENVALIKQDEEKSALTPYEKIKKDRSSIETILETAGILEFTIVIAKSADILMLLYSRIIVLLSTAINQNPDLPIQLNIEVFKKLIALFNEHLQVIQHLLSEQPYEPEEYKNKILNSLKQLSNIYTVFSPGTNYKIPIAAALESIPLNKQPMAFWDNLLADSSATIKMLESEPRTPPSIKETTDALYEILNKICALPILKIVSLLEEALNSLFKQAAIPPLLFKSVLNKDQYPVNMDMDINDFITELEQRVKKIKAWTPSPKNSMTVAESISVAARNGSPLHSNSAGSNSPLSIPDNTGNVTLSISNTK